MTAKEYHWVGIDLGNMPCNLACEYCSVRRGLDNNGCPTGEDIFNLFYDHIFPFLPHCPVLVFVSARSEPTLNKEAIGTLRIISTRNKSRIRFHLLTNGTNQKLIRSLAELGWVVTVSYDGVEQTTNRPFYDGLDSSFTVRSTVCQLAEISNLFSVRVTVVNWDSFEETVCIIKNLGCKFIEVSENLRMGCGKCISKTRGDSIKLVDTALVYPGINIFTPISGESAACPLAIDGNRLNWVFKKGRWQPTCCFVEADVRTDKRLRIRACWDGCLLKPLTKKWRDISQYSILKKGREAWEAALADW